MNYWQNLHESLKRFLSSRKTLIMLAGFIVYFAAKKGIILDPDDVKAVLIFFSSLLGAQGLNDFGKGKAAIEAANPKPPDTVNIQTVNTEQTPKEGQ